MKLSHKSTTKPFLALALISSFFVTAECKATETQNYLVEQEHLTIKIAPSSGLSKISCKFLDREGNQVIKQNVTLLTEFLNQGLQMVELNAYYKQHLTITSIKCK